MTGPIAHDSVTVGSAEGKAHVGRYLAFWKQLTDAAEPAYSTASDAMDAAWRRYDTLLKHVMAIPAKTREGLAVKALAVKHAQHPGGFNSDTLVCT
jgi:hypothetical protein